MNTKMYTCRPGALDGETTSEPSGFFSFPSRFGSFNAPTVSPEPYRRPVCLDLPRCRGCPYANHGFACRGSDGKCLRSEIARIYHFKITEEQEDGDVDLTSQQT